MDLTLFICMLFSLQLLYWAVGKRASKNLKNTEDYFLAGKQVSLFPLMMTFIATQVGGGVVLGAADEAYKYGWPVLLYPMGAALGLILLGSGVGRRLAVSDVTTVAQLFETVYKSAKLKKIASALSIVSLFMILVAQIIASGKFLASMGVSNTMLFAAFWGIVILYTAQGGLKAVISTDMVQAGFFSIVFFLSFGLVLWSEPAATSVPLPDMDSFEAVSSKLTGWLLMPLLFMVIEQDMGQRCFAGASPQVVSRASFLAGIGTMAVCVIPVFFGIVAGRMEIAVPKGGSVLMTTIGQLTGPWVSALVGCAVLAAIVSTATSLINAISSNLSSDFDFSFASSIAPMRLVKGFTSLIAVSAIFFAFYFDNVVDLLIQSYDLSVSCLFVPILAALFRRKGNALSASLAIVCGAAGFVLFKLYPIPMAGEILSVALSFAGYTAGEAIAAWTVPVKARQTPQTFF